MGTASTTITIPCPRCAGEGKITLPRELSITLAATRAALKTHATEPGVTSAQVHTAVTTTGHEQLDTATMNQLARLVARGLLRRTVKRGKFWLYALTPKARAAKH